MSFHESGKLPKNPAHIPLAYGNEEETGLMVRFGSEGPFMQPTHLAESLSDYLPPQLPRWSNSMHSFLGNGGLIYPGGTIPEKDENGFVSHEASHKAKYDNIERATPECATPTELAVYVQAHEQLMIEIAKNYVQDWSELGEEEVRIRIQRRVVDSAHSRKGCHDNFAVPSAEWVMRDNQIAAPLMGFIATRSFMTGAGLIRQDMPRFAQKIDGLADVNGYGYAGYMYRVESQFGDERLEIRSNDINISPWAIRARIGGVALMLAALQTPLKDSISDKFDYVRPMRTAKVSNFAEFTPDGQLIKTFDLSHALDVQEYMADIFIDKLPRKVDIPPEYAAIARELKEYCIDFRAVLAGHLPLEFLADRSDFAAKFSQIIANRQADGKPLTSIESMRDDMLYDYIGVASINGSNPRVRFGEGYKLRSSGAFKDTPRERDVQNAVYQPPKTTRAKMRAELIRTQKVIDVSWQKVELDSSTSYTEISLGPVNATTLSEIDKHAVELSTK